MRVWLIQSCHIVTEGVALPARPVATKYHKVGIFFTSGRGQPTSPDCSQVWRMNSYLLQSSTPHNEKFPVLTPHTSAQLVWTGEEITHLTNIGIIRPHSPGRWCLVVAVFKPKIFTQTDRKHFEGNLGNYWVIWYSSSSQVLTLNEIFCSCFYNEIFRLYSNHYAKIIYHGKVMSPHGSTLFLPCPHL